MTDLVQRLKVPTIQTRHDGVFTTERLVACDRERNQAATEIKHLQTENKRLREALEGWMIDHGHKCRICMERSQTALKEQT